MFVLSLISCEWQFKTPEEEEVTVVVDRYDRIQSLYLTTGDFSALQQMNTAYPMQTRTLIEDVLRIGKVDDTEINKKFLHFYQDSTLQILLAEAEQQYASMDDINARLTEAFRFLAEFIPNMEVPRVYAQIGSLDQSVIVGNNTVGICLDKYLGADYPLYQRVEYGYKPEQLQMMTRRYIVPDCLGFYLLSLYPLPTDKQVKQLDRDIHIGKIQWVVNQALGEDIFHTLYVQMADRYMRRHPKTTIPQLLGSTEYDEFKE
mgnify:CR=1 FL=1